MAKATSGALLWQVRRLLGNLQHEKGSDKELLARYTKHDDEAAFTALVRRHGPLVWSVCCRALGHHQDAEDTAQATFIVLARKAHSLRWRDSIAPWLFAVAQRLARKARAAAASRPRANLAAGLAAPDSFDAMSARELLMALDEEVAALPERYRGPVVLCELEKRPQEKAAALLAISLSTLRRRLEKAKQLLHIRLTRRGLAPAAALATLAMVPASAPAVPGFAHAGTSLFVASAHALELAETLLTAMTAKVKCALAVMLIACVGAAAVGMGALGPAAPTLESKQDKQLTPSPLKSAVVNGGPNVDALGDPLPPGAIMRLGSTRFLPSGTCIAVAFSAVRDQLVSQSSNGVISTWDVTTGKEVRNISGLKKGLGSPYAVAPSFALSLDGNVIAGLDGEVVLWDAQTGKELHRLPGTEGELSLAFSPKGGIFATANETTVQMWDVSSGKLLKTLQSSNGKRTQVAFSLDGQSLVASHVGERPKDVTSLSFWETASGKFLRDVRITEYNPLMTFALCKDNKHLVTTDYNDSYLWDAFSGKMVRILHGAGSRSPVVLSPDGNSMAVESADHMIRVWDVESGKEIRTLGLRNGYQVRLAFSADGKTLAASCEGPIRLWDIATGAPKGIIAGHYDRVTGVQFAPDGQSVVTDGWDKSVRLWDAKTGKEARHWEEQIKGWEKGPRALVGNQRRAFFSPEGNQVAVLRGDVAHGNEVVLVFDTTTGKELQKFQGGSVAFSPDGKWIACGERAAGDKAGIIRLYDRVAGKSNSSLAGYPAGVASLVFTPDSKALLSGPGLTPIDMMDITKKRNKLDNAATIRVWDLATGTQQKIFRASTIGNLNFVHAVFLSPDGRTLAASAAVAGSKVDSLSLCETDTGGRRGQLQDVGRYPDIAFSPDGRTAATPVGKDFSVCLWDVFSGSAIGYLEGHRNSVTSVAFSPDGKTLVSGSLDSTALIWDVNTMLQPAKVAELDAAHLEYYWESLRGESENAFISIGRMVSSPKATMALLRERLKPAPTEDIKRIEKFIADLDSDQFKTRDSASKAIEKMGESARPALLKAIGGKMSLETKQRLELLLAKLGDLELPAEIVRQIRAVEVLEFIGSPDARELLATLGDGASEARLTREARAALARLMKRSN